MADLHFGDDKPNDIEREAVDGVVADTLGPAVVHEHERLVRGGTERRSERRHLLLPVLHALQRAAGWISPGGLNYASEQLQVPPAEAYGVATFYEMFRFDDPGHSDDVVHVCVDAACQIADSEATIARLEAEGRHVHRSPCLGQCERPTALFIQGRGRPDRVEADSDLEQFTAVPQALASGGDGTMNGDAALRLLKRVGVVDPSSIESYIAAGGYQALAAAFERGPDGVVAEVAESGLMGRGGAAFPTGFKWKAVSEAVGDVKYVVVNADESEPGTFKDRVLIENDPFSIIEAATIAGFATGASKGWIYIRGEYPLATERLRNAIEQARAAGYLGDNISKSGFSYDIEVRRGAGAYICGEETALFNSLEGFRGEPRQKPPFPTTNGLFDLPTAINNPETLVNVLDIVAAGGAAYKAVGTEGSSGTKLFCVSGHLAKPGVYEVEFGTTLRQLIDMAGGPVGELRAIMLGGAAGSFVRADQLDLPLSFEGAREAGVSLGSGVVMAFNDTVDFGAVFTRLAEFFRNESCGQCVPCRIGTVRQHEVLINSGGHPANGQAELLADIDLAMKDASICGLGHTAATAVRSGIALGLIGATS